MLSVSKESKDNPGIQDELGHDREGDAVRIPPFIWLAGWFASFHVATTTLPAGVIASGGFMLASSFQKLG
ncbi:hypothetical protein P167DRAFT_609916 [Morchella conica CCBAS932]|uniref:Uncharacterized protein n=1 Tax=Morchella conica CCBAS932 TaxID=1392247 RepID=A0A3N4K8H7_9PEZI|nr:hypothetical protein P167DRAFT_609916 [Morchella conica CCBAS932]